MPIRIIREKGTHIEIKRRIRLGHLERAILVKGGQRRHAFKDVNIAFFLGGGNLGACFDEI